MSMTSFKANRSPARRRVAFARALAVVVIVLVVDRITKHARNSGVAFGFFAGGGALVLVLTLTALAVLVVYFALRPQRPLLWLPTGLLVGGAIGNLIDRIANGSVTDFIKLPFWPAFNVSDMAITFGVLTLLYVLEGPSRKDSEPASMAQQQ
jgi:signal peptidase II